MFGLQKSDDYKCQYDEKFYALYLGNISEEITASIFRVWVKLWAKWRCQVTPKRRYISTTFKTPQNTEH